jgi:hypothetical protein
MAKGYGVPATPNPREFIFQRGGMVMVAGICFSGLRGDPVVDRAAN